MGLSKGYKELTEKDKRAVLAACIAYREEGELPRGSYVKIGAKLGLPAQSVARLWRAAKSTREDLTGAIHSPDVAIGKGHREGHLLYDREMLKEAILDIPLWKRSTVRSLAAELKISPTTAQRIIKTEPEVFISRSNNLKVELDDEKMLARIDYCFSNMEWKGNRTERVGDYWYKEQMDVIHVDEKWFYITKVHRRYILAAGEEEPHRTVRNKQFITKVMFICAQARPRMLSNGVYWDGKIGIWPLGHYEPAKNNSKNRPAGTMVWKNDTITKEVYFKYMSDEVLPAIMVKWPREAAFPVVRIQQDGAKTHFKPDYEPWVELMDHFDTLGLPYRIKLFTQPANSPDLNILDLGFFNGLQSSCLGNPKDDEELKALTIKSYWDYPAPKINRVFLTHMQVQNCILQRAGGNDYRLPHMGKDKLELHGQLPFTIMVDKDARAKLLPTVEEAATAAAAAAGVAV